MKKKLILKLIESDDTPKIGELGIDKYNQIGIFENKDNFRLADNIGNLITNKYSPKVIKPIAISDEEIKVGDNCLYSNIYGVNHICVAFKEKPWNYQGKTISRMLYKADWHNRDSDEGIISLDSEIFKIELFPEQFSDDIKQAIVEGKLKDNDTIEVEYQTKAEQNRELHNLSTDATSKDRVIEVPKLDSNNKAIITYSESNRPKAIEWWKSTGNTPEERLQFKKDMCSKYHPEVWFASLTEEEIEFIYNQENINAFKEVTKEELDNRRSSAYEYVNVDNYTEEDIIKAANYGFDYAINSQHQGFVPKGNILQWLYSKLGKSKSMYSEEEVLELLTEMQTKLYEGNSFDRILIKEWFENNKKK